MLVATAAPHIPGIDGQVIERLPFRAGDPTSRALASLRAALAKDTANPELAVRLARAYFDLAAAHGDPRYIGYAQAALARWWQLDEAPTPVLVMRAMLRQYRHDFAGALTDLDKALAVDAGNAQAWSVRATIHVVQAKYAEARLDCNRMAASVSDLTATACVAFIDGLTGKARQAHDTLRRALAGARDVDADQRLWILLRMAEMAWRMDDKPLAEGHFRQALALDITDTFLLAAYADFLLDNGRAGEVATLLKGRSASDPLLLRLALAEHALRSSGAAGLRAALSDRYAAARIRGDTTHEQEESRFTLSLLNRPDEALRLALANWQVQREPRDARVVLEAALAARRRDAALPVLKWMSESGIEDVYLRRLALRLESGQVGAQ